jgi:hypothetical protein
MNMMPWQRRPSAQDATAQADPLTAEERSRLIAFRQQWAGSPMVLESGLDPRRVWFVRWLVEQGRLCEDR